MNDEEEEEIAKYETMGKRTDFINSFKKKKREKEAKE